MAACPKLSFHLYGISGTPSQFVVPSIRDQWHPIPSCHSIYTGSMAPHPKSSFHNFDFAGNPSQVVIPYNR
eukprot:1682083-Amphidinium_carterae.1